VKPKKRKPVNAHGKDVESVAQKIMTYLSRNPNAEDDLLGVARWWLVEHEIRTETERVAEALALLVNRDLLSVRQGQDGRVRYRLKPNQHG
jgi:hypothetical protein